MGAAALIGLQKFWSFGSAFDGLNKADGGDVKFGPTADFIFPQYSLASVVYAHATVTATSQVERHSPGRAQGSSTAQVNRKINGASAIPGQSKHWIYGLSTFGLNKEDFGQQKNWTYGLTDGDIFPNMLAGVVMAHATAIASSRVDKSGSGRAQGSSSAQIQRRIGGAAKIFANTKNGSYYGLEFFALNNNKPAINKFADQTLWYFGLPTPDIFPAYVTVSGSPAKLISAKLRCKRSMTGYPTVIKIISARIPSKSSSTV